MCNLYGITTNAKAAMGGGFDNLPSRAGVFPRLRADRAQSGWGA
jgi:hypothetical protein